LGNPVWTLQITGLGKGESILQNIESDDEYPKQTSSILKVKLLFPHLTLKIRIIFIRKQTKRQKLRSFYFSCLKRLLF